MVQGDRTPDRRVMNKRPVALAIVSLALSALFLAMALTIERQPPESLQFISGVIVDREPIYTRQQLTGFRLQVGQPSVTFTYRDPDPDVRSAWSTIQTARAVRIRFDQPADCQPTLWALEADGKPIATLVQVEAARSTSFWWHFLAAVLAGGVGLTALASLFKKTWKSHRRR
ncbi:hypothetical protein [Roseateles sp. L2-2]|uniref:hypothetical protein n=1 Tax=Roseateles sp. L2-2 TaxID=3422597 RepID=UPI003D36E5FE